MPLPAHLQAFDRLVDLIAEQMVADELAGVPIEVSPSKKTPAALDGDTAGVGMSNDKRTRSAADAAT